MAGKGSLPGDERAGRWIRKGSYRTFVPKALPPRDLALDAKLQRALESASMAVGRLDGIGRFLPDRDSWLYSYVRKEAVLSSQIEGTQSSLSDLLLHEHAIGPAVSSDDVREVSRYVAALDHGLARLRRAPIDTELVRELHRILVTGRRGGQGAGELRRTEVWIGGDSFERATFVPPPPSDVPRALADLDTFIESSELPVLVRVGLAHAQFETIHPFLDGNGRVGRMLITLMLVAEGVLEQPLLYTSLHFKRHRRTYYRALQRIRTHGDWEGWLLFFLSGIEQVANEAVALVQRLVALFERDRAKISASRSGARTLGKAALHGNLAVFEHLRRNAVITIPETARTTGISKPTVGRALHELEALRIAHETTGRKRDRVFVYREYVNLLGRDDR